MYFLCQQFAHRYCRLCTKDPGIQLSFKMYENLHWLKTPSFRVIFGFSLSLKGSASSVCCRLYLTASCRCPHHHQNEILDRTVQQNKNFIIDHLSIWAWSNLTNWILMASLSRQKYMLAAFVYIHPLFWKHFSCHISRRHV